MGTNLDHDPGHRQLLVCRPRCPLRSDRLTQAGLVLGRARVRVGQVLGLVLGCLLVLLLRDDDVGLSEIVSLGDLDTGHLLDELLRVARLLDSASTPGTLWEGRVRMIKVSVRRDECGIQGTYPSRQGEVLLARGVLLLFATLLGSKVLDDGSRKSVSATDSV